MSRIKVESKINVYEIEGSETKGLELPQLVVQSHWNDRDMVILIIGGKLPVTVIGEDLIAAIRNAMNTR